MCHNTPVAYLEQVPEGRQEVLGHRLVETREVVVRGAAPLERLQRVLQLRLDLCGGVQQVQWCAVEDGIRYGGVGKIYIWTKCTQSSVGALPLSGRKTATPPDILSGCVRRSAYGPAAPRCEVVPPPPRW